MELIFAHGALVRDGAWWWQPTADLIQQWTGIRSRALAMPSCGETSPEEASGGLAADAAALRRELDQLESAIVVGHSYGGTVIAEAGRHPSVAHLLYISSYLPDVGQSQGMIMSSEPNPVQVKDAGGGMLGVDGYDVSSFGARFLQDADSGTQKQAWNRVTTQAIGAFTTATTSAGWEGVDSTYIVCADDQCTSFGLQRMHADRATRSIEVPTGHHPFITRPDLVAAQIEAFLVG
jgi:pimeloyl-ACP methyl ester carboxylesterase